jgi:hypothetical protein
MKIQVLIKKFKEYTKIKKNNLLKKIILKFSFLLRMRVNIFFNKDFFPIYREEIQYYLPNKKLYVDIKKLNTGIYPEKINKFDIRKHFFYQTTLSNDLKPIHFSNHARYQFINKTIVNNIKLDQSNIYCMIKKEPHYDRIFFDGEIRRLKLDNLKKVELYYNRVLNLYNSIEKNGLINKINSNDYNIGILIDSFGHIHHFRTGHHRFAIAKNLNIVMLPISIQLISLRFLSKFEKKITEKNLASTLEKAISATSIILLND